MGLIVQEIWWHLCSQYRLHSPRRQAGAVAVADGHQVVVVVSAMAGTTNQLLAWCQDVMPPAPQPDNDAPGNAASTAMMRIQMPMPTR
jgi:aspartokinase